MDRQSTPRSLAVVAIGIAATLRVALALSITWQGFFIGQAVDSFLRTERAWYWSVSPFFITGPPMWPPLQYAIVGALFRILATALPGSHIEVPIFLNQFLVLLSLTLLFHAARRIGGTHAAIIACLLAAAMTYDIWISLSAQPEPILVLLTIALAYLLILDTERPRPRHLMAIGLIALLLQATHYAGWFVSISVLAYLAYAIFFRAPRIPAPAPYSRAAILALVLSSSFIIAWLFANYQAYGQPFQFIRWTQETHMQYSWMPITSRLLAVPLASFDAEPILSPLALLAIFLTLVSRPRNAVFLAPAAFLAVFLTVANVLLLGPTRYMPRATLPILWISLPFLAVMLLRLPTFSNTRIPALSYAAAFIVVTLAILRVDSFTNSVSHDLRDTARNLASIFTSSPLTAISNVQPWADQHALAALSLYPNRLAFISKEALRGAIRSGRPLIVLSDPRLMADAVDAGFAISGNSDYVFVTPSGAVPEDDPPSALLWAVDSPNTFLVHPRPLVEAFGFRQTPINPGDEASITTLFPTAANGCYLLTASIKDLAPDATRPWQFLHQVVANGIVLWSHDPTSSPYHGWQDISLYLMPTGSEVRLEIRILAIDPPGADEAQGAEAEWWAPSQTAFRDLSISQCP